MVNDKVYSHDSGCGDSENCHKVSTYSLSDHRLICNGKPNFDASPSTWTLLSLYTLQKLI